MENELKSTFRSYLKSLNEEYENKRYNEWAKSNHESLESIKNDLIKKSKCGLTRYDFPFITLDEKEVENYKRFFKKLDLDVTTHYSSKDNHRYMLVISW